MALNAFSTAARNAIADAFTAQIDLGSADATGDMQISTAAHAAVLATPTFAATAFGAASVGVCTAGTITDGTAGNTGTAAVLRIRDRDNATVVDGTVTATGGGGDLELNTVSIVSADIVAITSATITAPAS